MSRSQDGSFSGPALHLSVEGRGTRLVLVHGFTQTLVSWNPVAGDLASDHEVMRVDAPGHGGSTDVRADLAAGAALLGQAGGRATYVGYSMGGRLALRLALDQPDLVDGLILIGATAGIEDTNERSARREADEALARRIEAVGVSAFLDLWLAQPLFADLTPDRDDLAARRANTAEGLASSLRLAGTATMDPPWWGELSAGAPPTLVMAGEHDAKFTGLGLRMAATIGPNARFETISRAGHPCHLQQPATVATTIRRFANGCTNVTA